MKSIEILSVGIRLLGIYVFVNAFRLGANQYQAVIQYRSISEEDMSLFAYVSFGLVVLMLMASITMIKYPAFLSRWILPKTKEDEVIFDGTAKDIEVSIFTVIGVYILSWTIPDFVQNALWWWYSSHSRISGMWQQGRGNEYIIDQIVTVLEMAIGFYLCFRSQGISTLLRKLREAGLK